MSEDSNESTETRRPSDLKGCLTVLVYILGFGSLLAFFSKNFNEETMIAFLAIVVLGIAYLLFKHTEITIKIVIFITAALVVGGTLSKCSRYEPPPYEGPGVSLPVDRTSWT